MRRVLYAFIFGMAVTACSKVSDKAPCYDSSIVHHNACFADCPGIIGCDGKFYCNECVAASQGIRRK